MTKRRTVTISGGTEPLVPSRSRPVKPTAKAIHARHSAALATGGGRLPASLRKKLDHRPLTERMHPARPGPHGPPVTATRAGKRVPRSAKRRASRSA